MTDRFYSNAKLLISGEYLVSRGAKGLVLPLKFGQWMEAESLHEPAGSSVRWNSRVLDNDWFSASISLPELKVIETNDKIVASRLVGLLQGVGELNEPLLRNGISYQISTHTTFDHSWGLGSSSALIANLARWARINPFELFFKVSRGSGYDVAAALASGPIVYCRENNRVSISPVIFSPRFEKNLWFAYLGTKQDSAESMVWFNERVKTGSAEKEKMNNLTNKILHAATLKEFMHLMIEHEVFISGLLGMKPVKEEKFPDFKGEIKSLGAWGGDFILIASAEQENYIRSYFANSGMNILFPFQEIVLN